MPCTPFDLASSKFNILIILYDNDINIKYYLGGVIMARNKVSSEPNEAEIGVSENNSSTELGKTNIAPYVGNVEEHDKIHDKIKIVAISNLVTFHDHPFNIPNDENDPELKQLITSIEEQGLLNLPIVRPLKTDEDKYEIISGHRRIKACEKSKKYNHVPVKVLSFNDNEAIAFMITSNISRIAKVTLLERIKACYLLYCATLNQYAGNGKKGKELDIVGNILGISKAMVRNFIAIAKLSDDLLKKVGTKRFPLSCAVEISKIAQVNQNDDKVIEDLKIQKLHKVDEILVNLLENENEASIVLTKEKCKKILEEVEKVQSSDDISSDFIQNIISSSTDTTTTTRKGNVMLSFNQLRGVSDIFANISSSDAQNKILEILREHFNSQSEQ